MPFVLELLRRFNYIGGKLNLVGPYVRIELRNDARCPVFADFGVKLHELFCPRFRIFVSDIPDGKKNIENRPRHRERFCRKSLLYERANCSAHVEGLRQQR